MKTKYNKKYFREATKRWRSIPENRLKYNELQKEYQRKYREKNKDTDEYKQKRAHYRAKYYKKQYLKNRARDNVYEAILGGRLKKLPCETCGEIKVEAHHTNYKKPLEVNWLCLVHYREKHFPGSQRL